MKRVLPLILFNLMQFSAFADGPVNGSVVAPPRTITVVREDGSTAEYNLGDVNKADLASDGTSMNLSKAGTPRCGEYLGQLKKDFIVTISDAKTGTYKTAVVPAAPGDNRVVSVFGLCEDGSNTLNHIQLSVKKGSRILVQEFGGAAGSARANASQ